MAIICLILSTGVGIARILTKYIDKTASHEYRLGGYATSLTGRTPNQRRNAALAVVSLNGCTIPAHGLFSFNKAVDSWTMDRGYAKAPVSYDGELVPAYGGGVCQTSTTLYNAALLAGLEIVERHQHVYAPHYVPPGRDAAVAHPTIDLRLRNPYPYPLRIVAVADGSRLDIQILAIHRPTDRYRLESKVLATQLPEKITRIESQSFNSNRMPVYKRNAGMTGWRVVTYRTRIGTNRREKLSDNSYPAMDRMLLISDR